MYCMCFLRCVYREQHEQRSSIRADVDVSVKSVLYDQYDNSDRTKCQKRTKTPLKCTNIIAFSFIFGIINRRIIYSKVDTGSRRNRSKKSQSFRVIINPLKCIKFNLFSH